MWLTIPIWKLSAAGIRRGVEQDQRQHRQTVSSSYVAKLTYRLDVSHGWGLLRRCVHRDTPRCFITITPAGLPGGSEPVLGTRQAGKKQDIVIINYPENPNEDYSANPICAFAALYLQATWFRAKVYTQPASVPERD